MRCRPPACRDGSSGSGAPAAARCTPVCTAFVPSKHHGGRLAGLSTSTGMFADVCEGTRIGHMATPLAGFVMPQAWPCCTLCCAVHLHPVSAAKLYAGSETTHDVSSVELASS